MNDEITVDFEPLGRRARVARGATLLEAARQAGVGLNAVCGGAGTCGACRVRVVAGQVDPPAEGEVLACQTRALSDVRVDVPPGSITAPQRAQVEGHTRPVEVDPAVRGLEVALTPPGLTDLRGDATRLREAIEREHGVAVARFDRAALRQLPAAARANDWRVRAAVKGDQVVDVAPAGAPLLGLAVDVGTTKLAAYLVDLASGETLAAEGAMNPQIAYGEDVMARIAHATQGEAAARELTEAVAGGVDDLACALCRQAGRETAGIVEAVLVGNTCMHHLVLGLPVDPLGVAPYVPVLADGCDVKARDLGLHMAPGADVHLLPNVAGFVGGDHLAMLLATGIHETEEVTVGLDVGTNTEISLAVDGRLLSCSCASGPAFEGAHIRDGMRAAPGAVERVLLTAEGVEYQAIDDGGPVGICGSGILDAVAELRRIGVLQANGAMVVGSHPRVQGEGKERRFLLVPEGERGAPRDLHVTRGDVNEVQLAKAAIRAGVEVLLAEAGLEAEQVKRVVIAGAFGTYLDVGSALAVGMFPPLPPERFDQVGNAAGGGAVQALVSRRCRQAAAGIARRIEYVELTTHPRFVDLYAEALMLP